MYMRNYIILLFLFLPIITFSQEEEELEYRPTQKIYKQQTYSFTRGDQLPSDTTFYQGIRTLTLGDYSESDIPDALWNAKELETLYLTYFRSKTPLPNSLGRLKNLKRLDINGKGINEIPVGIGDLSALKKLTIISKGNVKLLPKEIGKLHKLEELEIRIDSLASIADAYDDMLNLKVISIYSSRLTMLPKSIFELNQLETLNLFCPEVKELQPEFGNLKALKKLCFSNWRTEVFPSSILLLKNLEFLLIDRGSSFNSIKGIPQDWSNLSKLKYLRISTVENTNELITSLINSNLTALAELNLTDQRSILFPKTTEKLSGLRSIYINGAFPKFEGKLNLLTKLGIRKSVSSDSNPAEDLFMSIKNLDSLQHIRFYDCAFMDKDTVLFSKLRYAPLLKKIGFNSCQLSIFPSDLLQLKDLYELDLWGNSIIELPTPFPYQGNWLKIIFGSKQRMQLDQTVLGDLRAKHPLLRIE